MEVQGLQREKQQLRELMQRQGRLVGQLQGELGSATLNNTLLQRQQARLADAVEQLLALVNHCNGKTEPPTLPLMQDQNKSNYHAHHIYYDLPYVIT